MSLIRWKDLDPVNTIYNVLTILVTFIAVPAYIWAHGLSWYLAGLFVLFFILTGMSITLGYHRLFSHRAFKAALPVRLFTLLFGAGAFEMSALRWASSHRRHHKYVDEEPDPYNATLGMFHAHIGWILHRDERADQLEFVNDLKRDPWVMWQHKNYLPIAILMGLGLPALLGGLWGGWMGALGGFLIPGVARALSVQQFTSFINSLCHAIGRQPYSSECTARDCGALAFFTFGEGYHNYHHAFQHDYRNGVKPWQFDPTKWTIWLLSRVGMASHLRRVPNERILQRQMAEQSRRLLNRVETSRRPVCEKALASLADVRQKVEVAFSNWERLEAQYRKATARTVEAGCENLTQLKVEFLEAQRKFSEAFREWREAHQLAWAQFA